jgi:hypothetical protein
MKRLFWIFGLWILLAGPAAVGQEASEPSEPKESGEEAGKSTDSAHPATPDDAVFVPSEQISADQEVTFPVDI